MGEGESVAHGIVFCCVPAAMSVKKGSGQKPKNIMLGLRANSRTSNLLVKQLAWFK